MARKQSIGRGRGSLLPIGLAGALVGAMMLGTGAVSLNTQGRGADIALTSGSASGVFISYTPGELWGGGNPAEHCAACAAQSLIGEDSAESIQTGQPVDPVTGDFTTSQTLISVPAKDGTLALSLTYDNQRAMVEARHPATHPYSEPGPFGWGWQSSFNASLYNSGTARVTVNQANGAQLDFQAIGTLAGQIKRDGCPVGDNGDWQRYTVQGSTMAYCAASRVDAQVGKNLDGESYDVTQGGGTVELFNYYGELVSTGTLQDPTAIDQSEAVLPGTSFHGAVCPSTVAGDCDIEVTTLASTQRSIVAEQAVTGEVLAVYDPMGREYTFGYTGDGNLTNITNFTHDATRYGYETTSGTSAVQREMTTLTDPNGNQEVVQYTAGMVAWTKVQGLTTSYSYSATNCGSTTGCLENHGTALTPVYQRTTVHYPDGEIDTDNYRGGFMLGDCYGSTTGGSCNPSIDDVWGFSYTGPTTTTPNKTTTETVAMPMSSPYVPTVTFDPSGNVASYKDPNGNVTHDMYNDNGYRTFDELCWTTQPGVSVPTSATCTNPPAGSTRYTYDADGDKLSATDPLGNRTDYAYYTTGQLCWTAPPSVIGGIPCTNGGTYPSGAPSGSSVDMYSTDGQVSRSYTAWSSATATLTTNTYNADGQMTVTIPPDGAGHGTPGSNPYETTTTYTAAGLTKTVTAPTSRTTTNTYDADGHVLTETDPAGVTTNTYDGLGRLCWTHRGTSALSGACTSPPSGSTSHKYLKTTGALTSTTDANGKTTTYTYGNARFPTEPTIVHDPMGTATGYSIYNKMGQACVTGSVNPGSTCQSVSGDTFSTYNAEGQLIKTIDPSGVATTYAYGNAAFPIQPTSMKYASRTTSYRYNANGQLDETTSPGTTNGASTVVTTDYNADSEPCWTAPVTWPSTSPGYCGSAPGGTGVSEYTYNTAGERKQMVDNNQTASQVTDHYTYDGTGHLTSATTDNARTVSYAYNKAGQASCIAYPVKTGSTCSSTPSASNSVVDQHYNSAGELVSTTDWLGHTIGYSTYTAKGQIQKVTYPTTSAETVSYGYTKDGNVTALHYAGPALNGQSDSYGFNTDDQLSSTGGIVTSASDTYTSRQRVAKATDPLTASSSVTDNYAYGTDGTVKTITPSSGPVQTDTYNALDELTKQSQPTRSTSTTTATVGSAISVTKPNGLAITPNGAKAYVSNGSAKTVTPITLSTGAKGTPISVPSTAGGIAINPAGTKAYVLAGGLVPITLSTGTAGAAIGAGVLPEFVGINPAGTKAYALNYFFAEVTPITLTSGTTQSAISVGSGPQAIAFNSAGTKAYVANWASDSVTPITLSSGTPLAAISVPKNPASIVVNPSGTIAYVSIQTAKEIQPITLSSGTLKTPIPIGYKAGPVSMNAGGTTLYVIGETPAELVAITVATGSVKATASLSGYGPTAMVPGTTKLYVNNNAGNSIIPVTFRTTTATAVPTNTYNADGERCWSAMSPTTGTCAASAPAGATSYGWNSLGQMCWSGPTTNASAGCSSPPAGTTTYTYDGQGLRMKATPSSGTASSFTWDTVTGGGDPLDIDDGTNAYVYGPTGTAPAEQINISTGAVSYLTSGSSGVQAVISSAGSLQEEAEYSTYGGQVLLAGSRATPFGFQGAYSTSSGLDYMINRYYTPTTDQFLSVDPDLAQTGQPYAFTGDDPLNLMDPLGLTAGWDCGGHEYGTTNGPPGGMTGCTGNTYTKAVGSPLTGGRTGVSAGHTAPTVPPAEPSLAQFAQAYDGWMANQLETTAAAFATAEAAETAAAAAAEGPAPPNCPNTVIAPDAACATHSRQLWYQMQAHAMESGPNLGQISFNWVDGKALGECLGGARDAVPAGPVVGTSSWVGIGQATGPEDAPALDTVVALATGFVAAFGCAFPDNEFQGAG